MESIGNFFLTPARKPRKLFNNLIKKSGQKNKPQKLLDEWIAEADACGLSYGNYRAQIAMGKTFEELKAVHDAQEGG